jgi:hypothetical protein
MTIGATGPIFYFLHYIFSPIENFAALDMRLTDLLYTKSILPSMVLGYYLPLYMSYFGPAELRLKGNFLWQVFPLWVALFQQIFRFFIADSVLFDRFHAPKKDLPIIRFTIGILVALSTVVWWHTVTQAPVSLRAMFIPGNKLVETEPIRIIRITIQYDYLFCYGTALLWVGYMFSDLKYAGMVKQPWLILVLTCVGITVLAGPGAAFGLAWLWREEVLANKRHKNAVVNLGM